MREKFRAINTDRQRLSDELTWWRRSARQQEYNLFSVLSETSDCLFVYDLSGRLLCASEPAAVLLGMTRRELLGRTRHELNHTLGLSNSLDGRHDEVARTGQSVCGEVEVTRNGRSRSYGYLIKPSINGDGSVVRIVYRMQDLTCSKKTDQCLRRSEERLERVLSGAYLGLWEWDLRTDEMTYNEIWAEILGHTLDEIEPHARSWYKRVHPEDLPGVMNVWEAHAAGRIPFYEAEYRLRTKSGEWKWILDRGTVVERDSSGHPLRAAGTHLDIDQRKRADEERGKLDEKIRQTHKMESLGVLASGIAHDFNNLLMVVVGNAELAMMNPGRGKMIQDNLERIRQASRQAAELCAQMLAYSGKGPSLMESLFLNDLIREMGSLMDVSISKKVSLEYLLPDNLPAIKADDTQLRQVILNLITNASEAIGDREGKISIETDLEDCRLADLRDALGRESLVEGEYVSLRVSDTGCGMTADTIQKIFDPFYTTKLKGRGLGLATLLGIVRAHKGYVRFESVPGEGTTFEILLPVTSVEPTALVENLGNLAREFHGSGTLLVIDDEEHVRTTTKQMLENSGFLVLTAPDGSKGVEVFQRYADEIDVVLLDLTMPCMDGEETFHELKKIREDVRVVIASGYSEEEVRARFADGALDAIIQKPFFYTQFIEMLSDLLNDQSEG